MKLLGILFIVVFLTSCAQNIGYGLGVAGIAATGNKIAATEVIADSETGIHGSIGIGTDIGL